MSCHHNNPAVIPVSLQCSMCRYGMHACMHLLQRPTYLLLGQRDHCCHLSPRVSFEMRDKWAGRASTLYCAGDAARGLSKNTSLARHFPPLYVRRPKVPDLKDIPEGYTCTVTVPSGIYLIDYRTGDENIASRSKDPSSCPRSFSCRRNGGSYHSSVRGSKDQSPADGSFPIPLSGRRQCSQSVTFWGPACRETAEAASQTGLGCSVVAAASRPVAGAGPPPLWIPAVATTGELSSCSTSPKIPAAITLEPTSTIADRPGGIGLHDDAGDL